MFIAHAFRCGRDVILELSSPRFGFCTCDTVKMSYAYLFKYIIIGDTGKLFLLFVIVQCKETLLTLSAFRSCLVLGVYVAIAQENYSTWRICHENNNAYPNILLQISPHQLPYDRSSGVYVKIYVSATHESIFTPLQALSDPKNPVYPGSYQLLGAHKSGPVTHQQEQHMTMTRQRDCCYSLCVYAYVWLRLHAFWHL